MIPSSSRLADSSRIFTDGDDSAFKAIFVGFSAGQTAVIGLDPTYSKQHGGLVIHGVSEKVFQLAQLISSHGQRCKVITLDISSMPRSSDIRGRYSIGVGR